jgi:hypothetical protein
VGHRAETADGMSAAKRKEVYLRKHGLSPRSPRSSRELISDPAASLPESGETSPRSPAAATNNRANGPQQQSWASKRKEHVLARAGVPRAPPTQADVAVTAVKFAAKLKMRSAGEKSWQEKRKEAYLATHNAKRPEAQFRIAAKSLVFASKMLKTVRNDGSEGADHASGSAPQLSRQKSAGEKSWTQKRKEAYLKRYGRRPPDEPPATDTAVTAVAFAGALKARAESTRAANAGSSPSDALELS